MNMTEQRSLFNDSRGSTLIEIIVSVLIVGIAFVPLMVGLNAALNVNKQNEKELYAENVATNVIEVAKAYGTQGLVHLVKNSSGSGSSTSGSSLSGSSLSGSSTSGSSTSGSSTSGSTISFSESIQDIFGEKATISKNASNKYFEIQNIVSGTGKVYSATITFDDGSASGEKTLAIQNDFSGYPQAGGVEGVVFVNYSEDDLKAIVEGIVGSNTLNTSEGITIAKLVENAESWLKRDIILTIEKDADGKFAVKKEIQYSYPEPVDGVRKIGGVNVFSPASPTLNPYPLQGETIKAYDSLKPNYIMTFKQLKYRGKDIKMAEDCITINKGGDVSGPITVYALCENGQTLKDRGYEVWITGKDLTDPSGANINVYCNLNKHTTTCIPVETFGTGMTGAQYKMKNITVVVKDDYGNEVITKTSTLIE